MWITGFAVGNLVFYYYSQQSPLQKSHGSWGGLSELAFILLVFNNLFRVHIWMFGYKGDVGLLLLCGFFCVTADFVKANLWLSVYPIT